MNRTVLAFFVLLLFLGVIPANAALVGYWGFNENTGDVAHDDSGNSNNGTILGATWAHGVVGSALRFDGIDDSVKIANSSSLNFHDANAITVSAWVNFGAINQTNYNRIVGHWSANLDQREYYIGITPGDWTQPANHFVFAVNPNGKSENRELQDHVFSTTVIEASKWYHVVGVYDGSQIRLYVNGYEEAFKNYSMGIYDGTENLFIGNDGYDPPTYPSYSLNGTIDEVYIYSDALSPERIQQLYNAAPVPEPATMFLFGSGLAALAIIRKRVGGSR